MISKNAFLQACSVATLAVLLLVSTAWAQGSPELANPTTAQNRQAYLSSLLQRSLVSYARMQNPALLLVIARLHFQLGEGQQALLAYRRFLIEAKDAGYEEKREAETQIAHLQRVLPALSASPPSSSGPALRAEPPPNPDGALPEEPPPSIQSLRRRKRGLIIGGSVLGATTWALTLITGMLFGALASDCDAPQCQKNLPVALMLSGIPVIGPFMTGAITHDSFFTPTYFLTTGAAQVAALTMIIVGARSTRLLDQKAGILSDLRLLPFAGAQSAGFSIGGRF